MPFLNKTRGLRCNIAAAPHLLASFLFVLAALVLVACGEHGGYTTVEFGAPSPAAPTHYYPPPGPPEDPWGPYIREAAARYGVPEQWIRAVMQQESGGEEQAVSPVGAMGLMQVMPETYEGLRERYGLGADPFDPHNNILAGAAYIREMYDRYGAPGFLAAYNAGPDRVDSYLAGASRLPHETVNYLAAVTPNLGGAVPLSGPLATYAAAHPGGVGPVPDVASLAAGCDLNAAYDPNHPCSSLMRAASAPAPVQTAFAAQTGVGGCDLSAAYDPAHPCTSVGASVAPSPPVQLASAAAPAPVQTAPAATPVPVQMASAADPAPVQTAFVAPTGVGGCDLSAAYDPSHPCTSAAAGAAPVASPAPAAAPMPVQPAAAPTIAAAAPAQPVQVAAARPGRAGGCDLSAAYDPNHPCTSAGQQVIASAAPPQPAPPVQMAATGGCDPDAAFDPANPCRAPAFADDYRVRPTLASAQANPGSHVLAIPTRNWAIQVGAFANPALARAVAEGARAEAPEQLRAATLTLPPIPNGRSSLYRARLAHLSASAAADACWRLNQRQLPCVVVQPSS